MITSNQLYKTVRNGTGWRGYINLSKDITRRLGPNEKEIIICIISSDEQLTESLLVKGISKEYRKFLRLKELTNEINKLKKEMEEGEVKII